MPLFVERHPRSMGKRPSRPDSQFGKTPEPVEISPDFDNITLEQTVLKNCGAKSLHDLPSEVAQNIITIDALDFPLSLEKRQSLLAYSFFVLGGASFKYITTYMKETKPIRINSLIDSVMDNPELTTAYTKVDALSELLKRFALPFSKSDIDRWKNITKEVVRLQTKGLEVGEIIARKREIMDKTNPNRLIY